jgi:translation initiation factor 2 alpha subunit (eIF-2alpha)
MKTTCGFYGKELPEPDQLVMVRIIKVEPEGAVCKLLEYDNMTAFMPISQYSRKRIRSIRQVVKKGNEEILQVLNVSTDKCAVDLSKKLLVPGEIPPALENFQKSRKCYNILRRVAEVCGTSVEDVCDSFGWGLYQNERHCHPLDLMNMSVHDSTIWDPFNIPEKMKTEFVKVVLHRIHLEPKKYHMQVSVSCYSNQGVDELLEFFKNIESKLKDSQVNITIDSPPLYSITCEHTHEESAAKLLNEMGSILQKETENTNVNFQIVSEPQESK